MPRNPRAAAILRCLILAVPLLTGTAFGTFPLTLQAQGAEPAVSHKTLPAVARAFDIIHAAATGFALGALVGRCTLHNALGHAHH